MLSHKVMTRQDVGRAASYYEDAADDYYAKEGEATEWQGKGAEDLGLEGPVDSDRFRELLAGKISDDVRISRASTRQDSKQRIGIDLTFSAPKSVSLQALVHGDAEIIRAHDRAVSRAVELAEERAQARHKINGKTHLETTGNLVVAKFRHETSRERDPQLHTHAIVMNLTKRSDGEWRALKNDEIIKTTKYLGAAYRAELAHELQRLGYQIRHERDGMFELAHMSREQLSAFSQRGAQIEERLAEKGLTRETATTAEKQQATLQSRAKKTATDRDELYREWQERVKDSGIQFDGKGREVGQDNSSFDRSHAPENVPPQEAAKRSVRYAVNHLTERQSVVSERELVDTAVKHGMGSARVRDIEAEITNQTDKGYLIREAPDSIRPRSRAAGTFRIGGRRSPVPSGSPP
ncbi:MobF family relaxase [Pokkaliibacter sp. MBI-7]|uniref:MobF family relaxase n=1 Tax=Pokkaliibacter sp. MBI-7 TaxID=3040600 RepID=UPI00244AF0DE|nr:MobF family relaxase [Pokkaliibacter sp. MBI-7]MDH2436831.1 MobF family relaxase [Pokkaliibacter sp. MBI-7]